MKKTYPSGIHNCNNSPVYGDWRVVDNDDNTIFLDLNDISYLLTKKRLKTVAHDKIGWKGEHLEREKVEDECLCCEGERYKECNIDYPCIIAKDGPNPYFKEYRLIDGKHRMAKMRAIGISKSSFYVIPMEKLIRFLKRVP